MASHSPQRSRRPQAQQLNQGATGPQQRELSPSPTLRDRPRNIKVQSMPMVPTSTSFAAQQSMQAQALNSPSIASANGRRSPQLAPGQMQRLLPTPPHPQPPSFSDMPDRRLSPASAQQQSFNQANSSQYARPIPRPPPASFLSKFNISDNEFEMTPELLAQIERADQQQAQYLAQPHSYSSGPHNGESPSPPRPPNGERVRGPPERTSPTDANGNGPQSQQQGQTQAQRRTRDQLARESPKARERQPAIVQAQMQAHSSEGRASPAQHSPLVLSNDPHPASYLASYNARESPPSIRRPGNNEGRLNVTVASQTPPQPSITGRADRSLPVQEEAEDEITSKNGAGTAHDRDPWQATDEQHFSSSSPTPSSDLNPDGSAQRFENLNSRSDGRNKDHKEDVRDVHAQFVDRDSTEDEGSYTPRSPTAPLPEEPPYPPPHNGSNRVPVPVPIRPKPRNGSTDLQMRSLEDTFFDKGSPSNTTQPQPQPQIQPQAQPQPQQPQPQLPSAGDRPTYVEPRRPVPYHQAPLPSPPPPFSYPQQQQQQPQQPQAQRLYPRPEDYYYPHPQNSHLSAGPVPPYSPHAYLEDFGSYGEDSSSAIYQSYIQSSRPEAPVPPTPQTHTAAPSPSPLNVYANGRHDPALQNSRATGSPYPFPYNHVRRQRPNPPPLDPSHPSFIAEQMARQWQVYAQNQQSSRMSDSTLSPSSTPFPAKDFHSWAFHHTNRMLGRNIQPTPSLHSSPSHQPVPLPLAPAFRKKMARRATYTRKPPPRVESTQPRETSPELSSSGEETAGEGDNGASQPSSATETAIEQPIPIPIILAVDPIEEEGEWVDEEDEDDFEDLIDLEYHPGFIKNISKRRRKWEVGWENLIQSFQALDRQTDATMVLLASPSHTTKLHQLRSRSVRRNPHLANSADMKEIRTRFSRISSERRATRPEKTSLVDRLMMPSGTSGEGSDGSSGSVEENLRRALDAALGSLGTLGNIYEQREARVLEELQRSREDRERVELLLKQVLGDNHPSLSNLQLPAPSARPVS